MAGNHEDVRDKLIEVARNRGLTTYGELEPIAELPAVSIGPLVLDGISRAEAREGRPMLSAVVVNQDTGRPGDGFCRLAAEIGRAAIPDPDARSGSRSWRRSTGTGAATPPDERPAPIARGDTREAPRAPLSPRAPFPR